MHTAVMKTFRLLLVAIWWISSFSNEVAPNDGQGQRRILWINPVGTDMFDEHFRAFLDSVRDVGTRVDVVSLNRGPLHLEYHFYEAMVAADLLDVVRRAESDGYDAAVIGCFYDPFLTEAREVSTSMVVAAPAESSLSIAATLGHTFSIIVGRRKWIPRIRENAVRYGFGDRLASFKSVNLGVHDFQKDPALTEKLMLAAAREAIDEDGAEVIVLGCTAEFGFYRRLQYELGVPVIDVAVATLEYVQMLAGLRERHGWTHSKAFAYEGPPEQELEEWGLLGQYGYDGMNSTTANDGDRGAKGHIHEQSNNGDDGAAATGDEL